jgi:hypothetical protein
MKKIWIGVFVVVTFLVGREGCCEEWNKLSLRAEVANQAPLVGMPIEVHLWIENTTDHAIEIPSGSQWRGRGKLFVSLDGNTYKEVGKYPNLLNMENPYSAGGTKIKAGQRLRLTTRTVFVEVVEDENVRRVGNLFATPGKYFLRAQYGRLEPFNLEVTIRQPAGDDEAAWSKLQTLMIKDKHDGRYLYTGISLFQLVVNMETGAFMGENDWAMLRQFLEEHPNSIYSYYVALGLGKQQEDLMHEVASANGGAIPTAKCVEMEAKIARYYKMAADIAQEPHLRERALYKWVMLVPVKEAVKICQDALVEYPGGLYRKQFEDRLAYAQKALIPEWRDPIFKVGEELEAMGYDLSLDPAMEARLDRELAELQKNVKTQFDDGEIPFWKYRETCVQIYKEWVMANLTPHPRDQIPPKITVLGENPVMIPCGGSYTDAGATAVDETDGDLTSAINTISTVNTAGAGSYTVTYRVSDAAGNETTASRTVKVFHNFTGFLPPIGGADATGGTVANPVKTFKAGSKIPVKFTITCGNAAVNTGNHTLQVIKWNNETTAADPIDAAPADAATQGNQFRWADDHWQYVLDIGSTGMAVGTWELRATLSDGSTHSAFIGVK